MEYEFTICITTDAQLSMIIEGWNLDLIDLSFCINEQPVDKELFIKEQNPLTKIIILKKILTYKEFEKKFCDNHICEIEIGYKDLKYKTILDTQKWYFESNFTNIILTGDYGNFYPTSGIFANLKRKIKNPYLKVSLITLNEFYEHETILIFDNYKILVPSFRTNVEVKYEIPLKDIRICHHNSTIKIDHCTITPFTSFTIVDFPIIKYKLEFGSLLATIEESPDF